MAKALVLVPFAMDSAGVANRRVQLNGVKLGPEIDFDFTPVTTGHGRCDKVYESSRFCPYGHRYSQGRVPCPE